jgi:hypothetical protein
LASHHRAQRCLHHPGSSEAVAQSGHVERSVKFRRRPRRRIARPFAGSGRDHSGRAAISPGRINQASSDPPRRPRPSRNGGIVVCGDQRRYRSCDRDCDVAALAGKGRTAAQCEGPMQGTLGNRRCSCSQPACRRRSQKVLSGVAIPTQSSRVQQRDSNWDDLHDACWAFTRAQIERRRETWASWYLRQPDAARR